MVITDDGSATCNVYVWTNYEWYNSDFPTPMESGFGTNHTLTLVPDTQGNYQIVSDAYNEWDISGINTEATSNTEIMSLTASFSTSSMHPFATTTTGSSQVFNRSKAAEYANLYVGSYTSGTARYSDYYNRMYRNFNSADGLTGGDCVNYVSQCLYYAGLKKTSTWTYNNNGTVCTNTSHKANQNGYPSTHTCTADDTASTAWTVVSPFINAIQAAYASSYNTSPSTSSFHVGDIGFLSSGGTPYHAFICVGVSGSTFLINAHNNDRKQVSYNSSSITNLAIHCLHIHNPSSSWLKYNSTSHRAACDSGCGYSFYGTHYAQTPGTNVACLGCGYVGNINQGST